MRPKPGDARAHVALLVPCSARATAAGFLLAVTAATAGQPVSWQWAGHLQLNLM
jgi:hypothetical protein